MPATEAGHHPSRSFMDQDGSFHLNGAAFYNSDGNDIAAQLDDLDSISTAEFGFVDGVTAGTVAASKAAVVDANKDIGDFRNLDAVNIDAGASGTAGSVDVFPTTASKGKLIIACDDQTGDTSVTVKPNAMGQATVVNIPDPGAATSYVAQSTAALTLAEVDVLDGATAGTQVASKAVIADANVNTGISKVTELHIGATGAETQVTATGAELNLVDGSVVANSVASKAALVDSEKKLQSNANNGTVEAGVTAVHYGDGVNMTAVLTLTNVPVTVGISENLGVGALIYTLPAGACLIRDAYMSVGISGVAVTTDTPEIGLGTVIASGVVVVLSGTATFEDIITGQVAADTNGTPTVKGAGPTAGAPLEITTAGAHTVHVNLADGWGNNTADAAGLLNGTVVISFIRQAA